MVRFLLWSRLPEQASSLLMDGEVTFGVVPTESILKGRQDAYPTKYTAPQQSKDSCGEGVSPASRA